MNEVVIIGGGFAGASLGYFLSRAGLRPLILEADSEAGGGSRGLTVHGEEVSLGVRALHLRPSTEVIVLETLAELFPESSHALKQSYERGLVFWNGKLFPFPIQNGFANLSLPSRIPYLLSYLNRPKKRKPTNFAEWAESQWGRKLAEPIVSLSRKSWATDPSFIDIKASGKIRTSWTTSIVKGALFGTIAEDAPGMVVDPRLSSTDIVKAFLDHVDLETNARVVRGGITLKNFPKLGARGEVRTEDGKTHRFKHLVSTIPLAAFHHLLNPEHVKDRLEFCFESLNHNHLAIFAFPIPKSHLQPAFRTLRNGSNVRMVWFPGKEPFQRISFASTFTEFKKLGDDFEIIVLETSIPRSFRVPTNSFFLDDLFSLCGQWLKGSGLVMPDIQFNQAYPKASAVITPGYILFDKNYHTAMAGIRRWVQEVPITFFGRYGAWNNFEIDHVMRDSKQIAEEILEEVQ